MYLWDTIQFGIHFQKVFEHRDTFYLVYSFRKYLSVRSEYLDHEEDGDPLVVGVVQVCTVKGLAGTGTLTKNWSILTCLFRKVDIWR